MAFLTDQKKNASAEIINNLIVNADARIDALVQIRAQLIVWQTTLAGNLVDYTNADRTEYNAELTRLNNRINSEL